MNSFYDDPLPAKYYFVNAPEARTRREESASYVRSTKYVEPRPYLDTSEKVIHTMANPYSMNSIVDRQIVLQSDNRIRKSVRIGCSNLSFEKSMLELVRAKTSAPVPQVYNYYTSAEFEHLVIEKLPGETLEKSWPSLDSQERKDIADEVVKFLYEIRKLHSANINAALLHRKPLRPGLVDVADFNKERFSQFPENEPISAFLQARISNQQPEPNVLTHGDLDWSNILIVDKKVSGIVDWECSGYFPAYWEWVVLERLAGYLPAEAWFSLLLDTGRLELFDYTQWHRMWEIEQLHQALGLYTQWGLMPEAREGNRAYGWAKVTSILGLPCDNPPPVCYYPLSSEHPFWAENRDG